MSWGSYYWKIIHYLALNNVGHEWLSKLIDYIPCEECKEHWVNPIAGCNLIEWSLEMHNKVNNKLGRWDKWDRNDFEIAHKNECEICNGISYNFDKIWHFIHIVAHIGENNRNDTIKMLKEFQNIYPCAICRNQLFLDDPMEKETLYDWTVRHHNRINNENRSYIIYIDQTCYGCSSNISIMTAIANAELS